MRASSVPLRHGVQGQDQRMPRSTPMPVATMAEPLLHAMAGMLRRRSSTAPSRRPHVCPCVSLGKSACSRMSCMLLHLEASLFRWNWHPHGVCAGLCMSEPVEYYVPGPSRCWLGDVRGCFHLRVLSRWVAASELVPLVISSQLMSSCAALSTHVGMLQKTRLASPPPWPGPMVLPITLRSPPGWNK